MEPAITNFLIETKDQTKFASLAATIIKVYFCRDNGKNAGKIVSFTA